MKDHILRALALSQIRRKKVRTMITILAIVLASLLLTITVNFVASGNAMLVHFLGKDYGVYGGAYVLLLLIPAVILGMLIIAMSVIVISNAFRMSASERVSEFGTLKCVGATGKQIYKTVLYESFYLCIAAIPAGVLLGYLFSFVGIGAANRYMDGLNVLTRAMMIPVSFELSFVFSPAALLTSVLVSTGTALFSAMLPAKKAMKISALDCMKNGGERRAAVRYRRTKAVLNGKKGIEYQLARKNAASEHKKMKSAVTAFSFSIILFVTMSGLKEIADGVMAYISMDYGYNIIADYTSNYDRRINPVTGRREYYYVRTIDSRLAEKITGELAAYEDTEIYGMGQDYYIYDVFLREDEITEEMKEAWDYLNTGEKAKREAEEKKSGQESAVGESVGEKSGVGKPRYELSVEIIILDKKHYGEICERAGAAYGGTILVNDYKYNDHGTERHIAALPASALSLRLEKADGSVENVRIDAILDREDVPKELNYPNENPVRLIVPEAEVRGYNWMASPEDEEGYMAHAKAVLEKYFPQGGKAYGEAGFVSRVFGAQDFAKIMNIAIVLAFFFLYAFVFLLGLIGIINVLSTGMFQVKMRAREFAVLQSIGMTADALQKMLNLESVLCAGKALATGLPIGVLLVLLMKYCVQQIIPVPFRMPWGTIIGVILLSFALMWGTVRASVYTLKNQNLVETIRM